MQTAMQSAFVAQPTRSIGAQPIRARKSLTVSCAQKGELIGTSILRCRQCGCLHVKSNISVAVINAPCLDHQYSLYLF